MIWGKTTYEQLWEYRRHKWFAWYPVTLDNGRWVWWEYIWRQKEGHWGGNSWVREPLSKQ